MLKLEEDGFSADCAAKPEAFTNVAPMEQDPAGANVIFSDGYSAGRLCDRREGHPADCA